MIILPRWITRRLKKYNLYYVPGYRYTYRSLNKTFYFHELFQLIKGVKGDIVECGVGYGNSIVILAALAEIEGKDRSIIGFDSFEGFPDTGEDWSRAKHFRGANLKRVQNRIKSAKLPNTVDLRQGFLEKTLKYYNNPVALLHIDVDIASSYTEVLEHLWKHVAPGGVVLFDEYNNPHWGDATKAIDAFFQGRNLSKCKDVDKYYIIK